MHQAHAIDSDCAVDPDTGCCSTCGVSHDGPPCPDCGAVAFHLDDCPQLGPVRIGALTLSRSEAQRCGLLPEQIRARSARQLEVLRGFGLDGTAFGRALAARARRVG